MLVRSVLFTVIRWNFYWAVVFFNVAKLAERKHNPRTKKRVQKRMNHYIELCEDAIGVITELLDEMKEGA